MPTRRNCCLVNVVSEQSASAFLKEYRNKKWFNRKGDFLNSRCQLSRVILPPSRSSKQSEAPSSQPLPPFKSTAPPAPFLTRKQKRERAQTHVEAAAERKMNLAELRLLPELNPPEAMPRGNVGTPRDELLALMANLPTSALKRLGNPFGKPKRSDNYSEVSYRYGDDIESRYAHVNESDSEPEEWDRHDATHPMKEV